MKRKSELSWTTEEFEDVTTRAYIALHERGLENYQHYNQSVNRELSLLTIPPEDMRRFLKLGIYIHSESASIDQEGYGSPYDGFVLASGFKKQSDFYAILIRAERVKRFARLIRPVAIGRQTSLCVAYFCNEGNAMGRRYPYTVTPSSAVSFSNQIVGAPNDKDAFGLIELTDYFQSNANSTWRIRVKNEVAPIDLGCSREEVKSLLYARNAPMTESGRKRPILHLVSSHRRRMKEGIEIDIDQFLRGTREIEMGGQVFQVVAPQALESAADRR